jgi:chromosome segregation ATPase
MVALVLVVSRLDLANELTVVRSQLTAANQELAENQREIDNLEDEARGRAEALNACRDSADLGEQVRRALEVLQKGLDKGDEGTVARGVAAVVRLEQNWARANDSCLEATRKAEGS